MISIIFGISFTGIAHERRYAQTLQNVQKLQTTNTALHHKNYITYST